MGRSLRLGLVLVAALALLATPAEAVKQSAARSMTIRLISVSAPPQLVRDRPPKGKPSPGDVVTQSSVLRNAVPQFGEARGEVVGGDYAVYTLVNLHVVTVTVRVTLPGGTLRVVGREDDSVSHTTGILKVVDGRGAFANARGTQLVRDLGKPTSLRALNVYRLRLIP